MVGTFSTSLPFGNFNLLNLNEYRPFVPLMYSNVVCVGSELVLGKDNFNFRFIEPEMSMRPEVEGPRSIRRVIKS